MSVVFCDNSSSYFSFIIERTRINRHEFFLKKLIWTKVIVETWTYFTPFHKTYNTCPVRYYFYFYTFFLIIWRHSSRGFREINTKICVAITLFLHRMHRLGLVFNNYEYPTYYCIVSTITVSLLFALFYKHNYYTKLCTSKLCGHESSFPIHSTVAFVVLLLIFENRFNRI